ncbi:isochorismatase family cysteine hydrolase [Streptomyces sp. NPDC047002]|uniref:cysteine hydrolase family protein n=1 Tax=Streptomyces sp. NPDC047002 TaxID=3155475 RepID=UPI003455F887
MSTGPGSRRAGWWTCCWTRSPGAPPRTDRGRGTIAAVRRCHPSNKAFAPLAEARALGADEPGSAIHDTLRSSGEPHTVVKTRISAFSTTSLDPFLRERGIDTLVLAGIYTSGVVLSTVLDGADRDYRLLVIGDACADADQDLHTSLLGSVLPLHADILGVADSEAAAYAAAERQQG